MDKIEFNDRYLCLLDVNQIIESISTKCVNEFTEYGLKFDFTKKIPKRFIYSALIFALCDAINKTDTNNKVVLVYSNTDTRFGWFRELNSEYTVNDLQLHFEQVLKKIKTNLPLRIVLTDKSWEFIETDTAEQHIFLNAIGNYCDAHAKKSQTFKKARKFIQQYELTFLSKDYFKNVKSKQVLYK